MPAVNQREYDGVPNEGFFHLENSHWHQCEHCDQIFFVVHDCKKIKEKKNDETIVNSNDCCNDCR